MSWHRAEMKHSLPAQSTPSSARTERVDARVGISRPHESAHLHVAGEAAYIDDLPELDGTLHCALGLSPVANGRLNALRLDAIRAMPGVVAVLTGEDIQIGRASCRERV